MIVIQQGRRQVRTDEPCSTRYQDIGARQGSLVRVSNLADTYTTR